MSKELTSPSDSGRDGRVDSSDEDGRAEESNEGRTAVEERDEGRWKGFILVKMSIVGGRYDTDVGDLYSQEVWTLMMVSMSMSKR
jgi:hypothetical protein